MQKIILDTNILVSACIQHGYSYLIVQELFSTALIRSCISNELFQEYFEVLNRKRFTKYPDFVAKAQQLLIDIEKTSLKYFPKIHIDIIRDQDDNKLLELAATCHADFLITGNTNDFTMRQYLNTKIVTPKEFRIKYITDR